MQIDDTCDTPELDATQFHLDQINSISSLPSIDLIRDSKSLEKTDSIQLTTQAKIYDSESTHDIIRFVVKKKLI